MFKKLTLILMLAISIFPLLLACNNVEGLEQKMVQAEGGNYYDISPDYLNALLKKKDFLFINVHIPYDGEIANTDLFIPYDKIQNVLEQLPKDRSAKIVLYCRSGSMSTTASKTLVRLGFNNVWNLEGGMIAWKNNGYPLLDKR